MKIFDDRRAFTKTKIFELDETIHGIHHLIDEKACIYATGSYGRLEATEHSDLDAFILGLVDKPDPNSDGCQLYKADEA